MSLECEPLVRCAHRNGRKHGRNRPRRRAGGAADASALEASPLYNDDLAPVPGRARTWTTYNFAALWISMAHCIPTYMLASGLMNAGMSWWQALLTILLGNTIVLVPMLLNSHAGTNTAFRFRLRRAAFGTLGSNVPALLRALVACGWFGIQAWIGGEAIHTFFVALVPGLAEAPRRRVLGPHDAEWSRSSSSGDQHLRHLPRHGLLRVFENWRRRVLVMRSPPVWAVGEAGGFGPMLAQPGKFGRSREFFPVFVPSLTA